MKIIVLQENLAKALSIVSKAVDNNPTLPVLNNILLEADGSRLQLSATNLQMSITMWIGAKVDSPGSITLPAPTFKDLVSNLSKERVELTLDTHTQTMNVRCGATNSNIKGIGADEFPPISHGTGVDIALTGAILEEMIRHTTFAAAKDDNRPMLMGIYTELEEDNITMAAADGYRLAIRNSKLIRPIADPMTVVIPAKALVEVGRAIDDGDAEIGISLPYERDIVTFHLQNLQISTQVLDGRFPPFHSVIPDTYITSTTMYTKDLLTACRRAQIFARDNANSGRMFIVPPSGPSEPGEVQITGKSVERGDLDGQLDASVEGEKLELSFNIEYLIDVLKVINEERIVFQSGGPERPGVIRPENRSDFIHIIMPMNV